MRIIRRHIVHQHFGASRSRKALNVHIVLDQHGDASKRRKALGFTNNRIYRNGIVYGLFIVFIGNCIDCSRLIIGLNTFNIGIDHIQAGHFALDYIVLDRRNCCFNHRTARIFYTARFRHLLLTTSPQQGQPCYTNQ